MKHIFSILVLLIFTYYRFCIFNYKDLQLICI